MYVCMCYEGYVHLQSQALKNREFGCGVDIGPRELIRLFRKYDDDNSGRINHEEFEKMIRELLESARTRLRNLVLRTVL